MADDYTTRLRFVRQVTNANTNVWGAYLNTKALDLIDSAIAGWANIDLSSGNATLTTGNGAADEARMAVIRAYGSGSTTRTVTIPSVEKRYQVKNDYGGIVLFKTAAGTGVVVLPGQYAEVLCNGTECYRAYVSTWGLASTISTASGSGSKTISLQVTGQQFTEARLEFNTTISAGAAQIQVNGASGSSGTGTFYNGTQFNGEIIIPSINANFGSIQNELANASGLVGLAAVSAANAPTIEWRSPGGITSLVLYSNGGAGTFTAGEIKVFLRG